MDHQYEKFLAVVEWGNFSRAAEQLHISQPALSMAIKELERELGCELIIRNPNYSGLSEAGKIVYASSRRASLEFDAMRQLIAGSKGQAPTRVRIGTIDSIGELIFSSDVSIDAARLEVSVYSSSVLTKNLLLDRHDAAFVTSFSGHFDARLDATLLGHEPMILAVRPDKFAVLSSALTDGRLPGFLAYNEESSTNRMIMRQFRREGIAVQAEIFSSDPHLLRVLALGGRGAAVLPLRMIDDDLAQGRLRSAGGLVKRPIYTLWLHGKRQPDTFLNAIGRIAKLLQRECDRARKFVSFPRDGFS